MAPLKNSTSQKSKVSYLQSAHTAKFFSVTVVTLFIMLVLYLSTFKLEFECCDIGIQLGTYFLVSYLAHESDGSDQVILNSIPLLK